MCNKIKIGVLKVEIEKGSATGSHKAPTFSPDIYLSQCVTQMTLFS
jgi:hypothetical protein